MPEQVINFHFENVSKEPNEVQVRMYESLKQFVLSHYHNDYDSESTCNVFCFCEFKYDNTSNRIGLFAVDNIVGSIFEVNYISENDTVFIVEYDNKVFASFDKNYNEKYQNVVDDEKEITDAK